MSKEDFKGIVIEAINDSVIFQKMITKLDKIIDHLNKIGERMEDTEYKDLDDTPEGDRILGEAAKK